MSYRKSERLQVLRNAEYVDAITRKSCRRRPLEAHSATTFHLVSIAGKVIDGVALTPGTHQKLHRADSRGPRSTWNITRDAINLTNLSVAMELHEKGIDEQSIRNRMNKLYSLPVSFEDALLEGYPLERRRNIGRIHEFKYHLMEATGGVLG